MILAIETSASVCSVGFYTDGKTILEYSSDAPMKHSELVGSFVEQGLQKIKDEISLVSIAIGPGSFSDSLDNAPVSYSGYVYFGFLLGRLYQESKNPIDLTGSGYGI